MVYRGDPNFDPEFTSPSMLLVLLIIFHGLTANQPDDHITQVFQHVIEHEKYINSEGKDIVIFFGPSQKGKSTTINALRNMPFRIIDGDLLPPNSSLRAYAEMGTPDRGGMSVTQFPQTWPSLVDDWVYVDTPGLFGTSLNPVADAGNLILLEMAVRRAASVRIVLVDEYHTIQQGIAAFQSIGKVLPRIILNPAQAPLLFLYNRFLPPRGVEVPANEPEKTAYIVERIKRHAKQMCDVQRTQASARYAKLTRAVNESAKRAMQNSTADLDALGLAHNADVQRIATAESYVPIIESNFDAGRVAYLDPMSNYSVAALRRALHALEAIQPEQFDFRATNGDRIEFGLKLANFLLPLDAILTALLDSFRVSDSLLADCQQLIEARISAREGDLGRFDDDNFHHNETRVKEMEERYHYGGERGDPETRRLEKLMRYSERNQTMIRAEIKSVADLTIVIYRKQWDLPAGWSLAPNRIEVFYKGSIPYFMVNEKLGNGTTALRYQKTPTEFRVIYTASDIIETLKESGSKIWRCTKDGFKFDGARGDGFKTIVWLSSLVVACGGGVGFAKGLVNGALHLALSSRRCYGSVELIAHAMDTPYWREFVDKQEEKWVTYMRSGREAAENLTMYKKAGLKGRIDYLIKRDQSILRDVDDWNTFRDVVIRQYREHEQIIRICANVLTKLEDREPQIITEFLNHWQQLQNRQPGAFVELVTEANMDSIADAFARCLQAGRLNFRRYNLN